MVTDEEYHSMLSNIANFHNLEDKPSQVMRFLIKKENKSVEARKNGRKNSVGSK